MWQARMEEELSQLKGLARFRSCRVDDGVSFSHNDYLGLSRHPAISQAGRNTLRGLGEAGSTGSRLLGGHSAEVEEIEKSISRFFNAPAALLFSSGYAANLGLLQAMGTLADAVVSDANIHASLIDGIRLTRLERQIVRTKNGPSGSPTGKNAGSRSRIALQHGRRLRGSRRLRQAWQKSKGF